MEAEYNLPELSDLQLFIPSPPPPPAVCITDILDILPHPSEYMQKGPFFLSLSIVTCLKLVRVEQPSLLQAHTHSLSPSGVHHSQLSPQGVIMRR